MGERCSIIKLATAHSWMECACRDVKRKFENVNITPSGVHCLETVILKIRYNDFLHHVMCNIQRELVSAVKKAIGCVHAD